MIISILRKEARSNLKGKWKKAILMMLIFYITTILLDILKTWIAYNTQYGLFATILNIIIIISLNYGLLASFINLKRGEKVNCLHFIYYAGRDAEKVWRVIGRLFFRTLGYIILIVLFGYLSIIEIVSLINGSGMRLSFFVEMIVFIVATIFFVLKMLYYSLNIYVLFDNRTDKPKNILNESERLMQKHRWDFVKMYLTFVGWFILGIIFSAGIMFLLYYILKVFYLETLYITHIPLTFILPYLYITTICFYDNLLYNNPRPKEDVNNKKDKKGKKKDKKKTKK